MATASRAAVALSCHTKMNFNKTNTKDSDHMIHWNDGRCLGPYPDIQFPTSFPHHSKNEHI